MKAVYLERDRLEALAKRLNSLSSGSSQELARMKEQRQQLRQELEQKEAQHGESLHEASLHQDNVGLEIPDDWRLSNCSHLVLTMKNPRLSSALGYCGQND